MYGIYLTTKKRNNTRNKIKPNLINGCRSGWLKIASEPTTLPVKIIRESVRTVIERRNQCNMSILWTYDQQQSFWPLVNSCINQFLANCVPAADQDLLQVINVIDFLTVNVRHFTVWQEIPQSFDLHSNPFRYLMLLIVIGVIIYARVTSFELIADVVLLTFILHRIVNIFTKNRCGIQRRRHGRIVCCIMLDNVSTGTKYMEHQTLCGFFLHHIVNTRLTLTVTTWLGFKLHCWCNIWQCSTASLEWWQNI